jgi:endonuclease I
MHLRMVRFIVACLFLVGYPARLLADAYDPPANYYNSVTSTGATLKTQLTGAMSAGHILRNYGTFRESAAITDRDPANPNNVLLVYNRASVPAVWDGGITWNREHTWPDSLQPQDASNSSTGAIADPHVLRPCNPSINSSRGNKPYGLDNTTGANQHVGSYYYPGDADRGDMARAMFYMDTRWSSQGFGLVETLPSGNQMGDRSSLIAWHYLDVPDEFERRRNQAVYSSAMNPSYYSNNRNAYIDRPWYVWSIYMNQANDSRMTLVGGSVGADASATSLSVNLASVLVGAAVPAAQTVQIDKAGANGTYFGVATAGAATSSINGPYNAYGINQTGNRALQVGLSTTTATAGLRTGSVTIDNLDVTTAGGVGVGGNDGNDVVTVNLNVLDHANPSFAGGSDVNALTYDFGTATLGSAAPAFSFDLFNLSATAGFTAGLDLDAIVGSGATSRLTTTLATFGGGSKLEPGGGRSFTAMLDTSTPGMFSASYTLNFSDENLPGATAAGSLLLTLTGAVSAIANNADFNNDLVVNGRDFLVWQRGLGQTGIAPGDKSTGDADGNGAVDATDLQRWREQFGGAPSTNAAAAVPEPRALGMFVMGVCVLTLRCGRRPRRG